MKLQNVPSKILVQEDRFFISSDYHLSHKNILKYDKRPFKDIHHHDETIIANHNAVVHPTDTFIFLGDFFFGKDMNKMDEYLARLNGNKYFIKGNHDHEEHREIYKRHGLYLGEQYSRFYVGSSYKEAQMIVLNHFRMTIWDKSHHGAWHLYGHSHGGIEWLERGKCMDVGIMQNNYKPFSFSEIKTKINSKEVQILDHHTHEIS